MSAMPAVQTAAHLLVQCLEAEGVKYVFGLPGEENITFIRALDHSSIRFILVRHEQGASFMADIYGRLTGRAGVCVATLGPGAINLLLGTADAQTDSTPLVAISAQVGLERIYKESHQIVDLTAMFRPVTKWAETVLSAKALPEMVRRAFDCAEQERPGATYLAIPQDIETEQVPLALTPLTRRPYHHSQPDDRQIVEGIALLRQAKRPIILAGHGAVRANAGAMLVNLAETLGAPVATTFMAKGIIPDDHPLALGVVGFMYKDYENFAFDQADLIISVGYELQEFAPNRINPNADKAILHIHHFAEEMDRCYQIDVNLEADINASLEALTDQLDDVEEASPWVTTTHIQTFREQELDHGAQDDRFPMAPQRIVSDIRRALAPTTSCWSTPVR